MNIDQRFTEFVFNAGKLAQKISDFNREAEQILKFYEGIETRKTAPPESEVDQAGTQDESGQKECS